MANAPPTETLAPTRRSPAAMLLQDHSRLATHASTPPVGIQEAFGLIVGGRVLNDRSRLVSADNAIDLASATDFCGQSKLQKARRNSTPVNAMVARTSERRGWTNLGELGQSVSRRGDFHLCS